MYKSLEQSWEQCLPLRYPLPIGLTDRRAPERYFLSVLENNLFEIWSTLFLSPAPSSTPQVLNKLSRTYKLRASSLTRGSFQEFGSCPLARYTRASSLLQKSTGRESSTAFSPPVRMQ